MPSATVIFQMQRQYLSRHKAIVVLVKMLNAVSLTLLPLRPSEATSEIIVQADLLDRVRDAWAEVDSGRPARAYARFVDLGTKWRAFGLESVGFVDCQRGILISAILAGFEQAATRQWTLMRSAAKDHLWVLPEPAADALVFDGNLDRALIAYRDFTHDSTAFARESEPDPVVAAGVKLALQKNWKGAIEAWSQPPTSSQGPNALTELQLSLVGLAQLELGEWKKAGQTWMAAARSTVAQPQISWLSSGNMMALSMLYHFRTHFRTVGAGAR